MADIQTYLDAIENAVYGEDVRGSIHDAIEIINDVGEKVITAGTAVTSPSSSVEGFFDDSLYFNTNTDDLWQCNGTGWTLLGNLKGSQGNPGNPGQAATIAVGTVTKGDNASVVNSGTSSAAVFDFVLPKGDPGPAGANTWGSITGDIDDQTDLKNALEDVYDQSEELVDRTVGWVCNNLFNIEAVEMGKDIYGEAAANSALFTLNCKPSTRYYLSVHGTNNLQVSYNTTALGPTEVLIASFPYDFLTTQYDSYIKICFTKSGLTKSDIEALQFMLTEVANAPYSEYHPTVEEELADKASLALLDDTVGWVGKNLAPCHIDTIKALNTTGSWSGNVYTVTTSGNTAVFTFSTTSEGYVSEIDVNGAIATSSANIFLTDNLSLSNSLKLSGCPSGGDNQVYKLLATNTSGGSLSLPEDYGNGADLGVISSAFRIQLRLYSGAGTVSHIKFYPMLRDASITDSTFEPYHKPVSDWGYTREEAIVTGVHQFLNIKATSDSQNDVTWTVNADKSISISTAQGGASATTVIELTDAIQNVESGVDYTLMGCPSGGSGSTYKLDFGNGSYIDYGNGTTFDGSVISGNKARIVIYSGAVLSNKVFKPLLKLAADTSDELSKFAMTNEQLTQEVTVQESACTNIVSGASVETTENGGNVLQKVGNIVFCHLTLSSVTATAWSTYLADIPSGYIPKYDTRVASYVDGKVIKIGTDGHIQTSVNLSANKVGISTSWITS